ncbi:MAG: hypothetical protein ACON46_08960, partial [Coraliomargaritaceae bacterium]
MKRKRLLGFALLLVAVGFALVSQTETAPPSKAAAPSSEASPNPAAASTTATATPPASTATIPKPVLHISHQAGQGAVDLNFKAQETDQYYLIEGSTELTQDSWTLNYGVKGDGKDRTARMPTHNDKGFYRLLRVDAKDPRLQMDSDNDGIPSAVEMSLDFNLNPGKSEDGAIDHDGDGYTALEEYLAGTKD